MRFLRYPLHSLTCLIALMTLALSARAQSSDDVLFGSGRDVVSAKVTSIGNGKIHAKRQSGTESRSLVVPFSAVDSIRFADGFRLRFQDGAPVRDNLLSAPFYEESLMRVKAEGVLALTPEETRSYYGPGYYDLVYKPYRSQVLTGIGKLGAGVLGSLISFPQRFSSSSSSMDYIPTEGLSVDRWPAHYQKTVTYDPIWTTSSMFFLGMGVAGVVDCVVPYFGYRNSLRTAKDDRALPTKASSRGLFWGGIAASVVGLGGMAVSYVELKAHPTRTAEATVAQHTDPNLKTEIPWALYTMFGSAVVANLGFSAVQLGAARLSAYRHLDGSPYAMLVDMGPTPGGYGLQIWF